MGRAILNTLREIWERIGKYRALVTDINLRGRIDGWEIAQQAREMDPARNVVHRPALAKVV
jgi:hypothetical protein